MLSIFIHLTFEVAPQEEVKEVVGLENVLTNESFLCVRSSGLEICC